MNAKKYYESKEWGNPDWDRATANQFDKSEMLDFAEHYASHKLSEGGTEEIRLLLRPTIPQTYGEAHVMYPWIRCQGHEWDNSTTEENVIYLIAETVHKLSNIKKVVEGELNKLILQRGQSKSDTEILDYCSKIEFCRYFLTKI